MNKLLIEGTNGQKFWATISQNDAIEVLKETNKGGIGAVQGYRPTSGYVKSPIQDMQIITRFSTEALYKRKIEALKNVTFNDVKDAIDKDEKLNKLSSSEQVKTFTERLYQEIESMEKTNDGDRSDGHRQGHDRCYCPVTVGVKVHFVTEKGNDGLKHPVLQDGYPVAESIMIHYLELNKVIREPGEYKVVNSGLPVRMSNAIKSVLNQRSVGIKTLSLKEGNFEKLAISRKTLTSEDIKEYKLNDAFRVFLTEMASA